MKIQFIRLTAVFAALFFITIMFQNCTSGFSTLTDPSASSSPTNFTFSTAKDVQLQQNQYKCTDAGYENFNCLKKDLVTKEGLTYSVIFRWNRVADESVGTVVWVLGSDGRGKWRAFPGAIEVEDYFDRTLKIRSVEIDFLDAPLSNSTSGGYWSHGGGYYSAALAYMEAVAYITANLKVGQFLNHVGGSNGTMVAAYALSHFDAGSFVDRFILHAGPFLPNLVEACNPNHFASFSLSPSMLGVISNSMGLWAYRDGNRNPCSSSDMNARMSVLAGAKSSYPNNGIHVVMGEKEKVDGFGAWIIESNYHWYSQIEAGEKTYQILSTIGHEMHWPSVKTYAAMGKPQPMGAAPTLTFSLTQDGPATASVPADSKVYGVIRNIDANSAMGCMHDVTQVSACDNPRNWSALPNSDWTFVNGVWRSSFVPSEIGLTPGKRFQGFNVNTKTGQKTALVSITIGESEKPKSQPPTMSFSKSYNGAAAAMYGLNDVVYGVAKNLPQNGTKACMQESSQFYLCNDPKNWTSLPNSEWQFVNGEWRAQFVPANIGAQKGKSYIGFQVNSITGERTPNVTISVENTVTPVPTETAIPEGLFMSGSGIYYSNGSAYCAFPSMDVFTKKTGRTNADGITYYATIPQIMRNDGVCQ